MKIMPEKAVICLSEASRCILAQKKHSLRETKSKLKVSKLIAKSTRSCNGKRG